ncbi:hypothetical protein, partial [Planktotalea sp.]|uniref:hypothetical protein n=1 Tax=Planktotalea sp. TaxID=2029877 RepID=UPI00329725E4
MKPQYVARQSSSEGSVEASESQSATLARDTYLFTPSSRKVSGRFTQWTYTSRGTGLQGCLVELKRI